VPGVTATLATTTGGGGGGGGGGGVGLVPPSPPHATRTSIVRATTRDRRIRTSTGRSYPSMRQPDPNRLTPLRHHRTRSHHRKRLEPDLLRRITDLPVRTAAPTENGARRGDAAGMVKARG